MLTMVRLRNCVATFRQSPRRVSTSVAISDFRKSARFLAFAGLWHAPQCSTNTGRMLPENSSGGATHARTGKSP